MRGRSFSCVEPLVSVDVVTDNSWCSRVVCGGVVLSTFLPRPVYIAYMIHSRPNIVLPLLFMRVPNRANASRHVPEDICDDTQLWYEHVAYGPYSSLT